MSRKLITFLGTGGYQACRYELGKTPSKPFKYVQLALAEILKPDRVIVFVTPSAYEKNYVGEEGLQAAAPAEVSSLLTHVEIPEGKSPEEIWEIFRRVFGHVEAGDVVLFDITHSFRSIPVIGLACLQYAGTLRDVVLEGVYYGAFEARDAEKDTAPIFDLTPFVQLMEWSRAVNEFIRFGHCGALHHQVCSGASSHGKKQKNLLRTLAGDLARTGNAIAGCRGKSIFLDPPWEKIPDHIKKLRRPSDALMSAFDPLLDLIEQKMSLLSVEAIDAGVEVRRGLGAVRWCLEHDMVQQAYSILQETMITHVCRVMGFDYTDKGDRMLVSQICSVSKIPRGDWEGEAKARPDDVQQVLDRLQPQLLSLLDDFSAWRNDIMHCKLKSDREFKVLMDKVKKSFSQFVGYLKSGDEPS